MGAYAYLLLTGGELRGKGPAASLPQPVPKMTSQPIGDAGALTPAALLMRMRRWWFSLVTTTQRNNLNQSFKVSAA